jgi:hypothetical protein
MITYGNKHFGVEEQAEALYFAGWLRANACALVIYTMTSNRAM